MKNWSEQFVNFSMCPSFNNFSSSIFTFGWRWIGNFLLFDELDDIFCEIFNWQYDVPIFQFFKLVPEFFLPVIFLLHKEFLCCLSLCSDKAFVKLLSPIGEKDHLQEWV